MVAGVRAAYPAATVTVWAENEHRLGLLPVLRRVRAPRGQRPLAAVHRRFQWRCAYGFVRPSTGTTWWRLLPTVSLAAFELALAAFVAEGGHRAPAAGRAGPGSGGVAPEPAAHPPGGHPPRAVARLLAGAATGGAALAAARRADRHPGPHRSGRTGSTPRHPLPDAARGPRPRPRPHPLPLVARGPPMNHTVISRIPYKPSGARRVPRIPAGRLHGKRTSLDRAHWTEEDALLVGGHQASDVLQMTVHPSGGGLASAVKPDAKVGRWSECRW